MQRPYSRLIDLLDVAGMSVLRKVDHDWVAENEVVHLAAKTSVVETATQNRAE